MFCIMVHSFCFLSDVSGSECILVMQYLNAAILCSIGWSEKKLMVVSVLLGFSEYIILNFSGLSN